MIAIKMQRIEAAASVCNKVAPCFEKYDVTV